MRIRHELSVYLTMQELDVLSQRYGPIEISNGKPYLLIAEVRED